MQEILRLVLELRNNERLIENAEVAFTLLRCYTIVAIVTVTMKDRPKIGSKENTRTRKFRASAFF